MSIPDIKTPKPGDALPYCRTRVNALNESIERLGQATAPDFDDIVNVLSETGSVISLLLNQLEATVAEVTP